MDKSIKVVNPRFRRQTKWLSGSKDLGQGRTGLGQGYFRWCGSANETPFYKLPATSDGTNEALVCGVRVSRKGVELGSSVNG